MPIACAWPSVARAAAMSSMSALSVISSFSLDASIPVVARIVFSSPTSSVSREQPARDVDAHDTRRVGDRTAAASPPSAGTIRSASTG